MSIVNTGPVTRRPSHPGTMLREDFLPEFGLTVSELATAIGVSRQSVNELLRGRRALTPAMALRLARLFGNSPEFWLNAQRAVDLWDAARAIGAKVKGIQTLGAATQASKLALQAQTARKASDTRTSSLARPQN
jgi:antitoxin HigA-1